MSRHVSRVDWSLLRRAEPSSENTLNNSTFRRSLGRYMARRAVPIRRGRRAGSRSSSFVARASYKGGKTRVVRVVARARRCARGRLRASAASCVRSCAMACGGACVELSSAMGSSDISTSSSMGKWNASNTPTMPRTCNRSDADVSSLPACSLS